jgi:hypothetical protein
MRATRLSILFIAAVVARFLNGNVDAISYGATPTEVRAIALSGQAAGGVPAATFDNFNPTQSS